MIGQLLLRTKKNKQKLEFQLDRAELVGSSVRGGGGGGGYITIKVLEENKNPLKCEDVFD